MCKRLSVFLIVVCVTLSLWSFDVRASEVEKVENGFSAVSPEEFNRVAKEYIERYIETIYLYKPNDLNQNTIKAVVTKESATASITDTMQRQITLDQEMTTVADLCDNISHFQNIAEYYRYTRSAQDIVRYNFSLTTTVLDTQMSDNCVTVQLYTYATFQYEEGGEPAACGDMFTVKFAEINGQWCIVDIDSEELTAYGLTKEEFDFASAIASFNRAQTMQTAIAPEDNCELTQGSIIEKRHMSTEIQQFLNQTIVVISRVFCF